MKKKTTLVLATLMCLGLVAWAGTEYKKFYVWVDGQYTEYDIDEKEMMYEEGKVTIAGITYELAQVDSITFCQPTDNGANARIDTIYVTYEGATASVSALPEGVTATVNKADVSLNNTLTDRELTTVLRGSSESGSLVYTGDYKTTIRLEGLTLTGSTQEAILIKDGKRIALELADGSVNTLSDAKTDGGQKAALYTKGHLEISGAGTLNLKGNVKHAMSSKEYLLIKKTAGQINITQAANDGIHAGQYVQVNGGDIHIKGIAGDGIQAEMAGDKSEDDGKVIVKGGTLDISVTAHDAAALKADSTLHIKEGTFTLATSGAGDKALKSKTTVDVEGGSFSITQTGKPYVVDGDLSYVTAVKATEAVSITGGTFVITNSVVGGRGFSCDGTVTVDGTADIDMKLTGNGGTAADAIEGSNVDKDNSGTTDEEDKETASYKVYFNVPTSTGGGGWGGNQSSAWGTVSLYKANGTLVANLTSTVSVTPANGGTAKTFYVYDFKQSDGDTYYIANPNKYTSSGGNRQQYTIKSATFSGPTNGKDYFYSVSSSYSTSGTTRTYNLSNVTSTYAGGNIGAGGTTGGDGFTAKGITADKSVALLGGTISIAMSGTGGKGVKTDGTLVIGRQQAEDDGYPILTVSTTGASYGSSTGGNNGGWGGPGGMGGSSSGSSSKAIKAQGEVHVYSGESTITTATNGAEGLESKTAVYIEGGRHFFQCYDDCINSAGNIYFNGGLAVCYATNNDAVDSNAGRTGAITIGNGVVLAYTKAGSPEEGLDCDNNSYIQITGTGIAISAGGAQGGGSSNSTISGAKQGYAFVTSTLSYSTGRYYTLADASGNNLITYSFPVGISSSLSLFTATGMKSGSTYTVKYSTTAPTDATTDFHGMYLGSKAKGTTSVTSFTAK